MRIDQYDIMELDNMKGTIHIGVDSTKNDCKTVATVFRSETNGKTYILDIEVFSRATKNSLDVTQFLKEIGE